jgi:GntR family transcriptional regulator, histidine utilization repressor
MTARILVRGSKRPSIRIASRRTGVASLHDRILTEVRGRILSGEWPPGQRIPAESELTAQYRCSRMTVNKAMSILARAGLIERRRKAGSFVARQRSQSAVLEIQDVKSEIEGVGHTYGYRLLARSVRKATRAEARDIGITPGTRVLALACLHTADDRPFCFEQRTINLDAVPSAETGPFDRRAAGPWLIEHVPWTEARHTISARSADAALAPILDIEPGLACLVIERRTWANGRPITRVTLSYPGPLREVVAMFKPAT